MKSNKSFILIMAFIVAIIIGMLVYYFSGSETGGLQFGGNGGSTSGNQAGGNTGSNQGSGNTTQGGDNDNVVITLSEVKDYDDFFSINTIINEYFQSQTTNDKTAMLNKLDQTYIKSHNITKNNIKNYMELSYESISYYSRFMYVKGFNNIKYYFVNGETQSYDFASEILTEKEGVNFMITVDESNRTYSVTPIISSGNVFEYAQSYKMKTTSIESNEDNKYSNTTIDAEKIIIYYITYYKNIMFLNSEKAYAMLTEDSKEEYIDYENYVKNLEEIYNNLSTNLHSYAAKGENARRKYSGIGMNQYRVDFEEKGIMNFKVDLSK